MLIEEIGWYYLMHVPFESLLHLNSGFDVGLSFKDLVLDVDEIDAIDKVGQVGMS
jgi:hypothetical protein